MWRPVRVLSRSPMRPRMVAGFLSPPAFRGVHVIDGADALTGEDVAGVLRDVGYREPNRRGHWGPPHAADCPIVPFGRPGAKAIGPRIVRSPPWRNFRSSRRRPAVSRAWIVPALGNVMSAFAAIRPPQPPPSDTAASARKRYPKNSRKRPEISVTALLNLLPNSSPPLYASADRHESHTRSQSQ